MMHCVVKKCEFMKGRAGEGEGESSLSCNLPLVVFAHLSSAH